MQTMMQTMPEEPGRPQAPPRGPLFWPCVAAGWGLVAFGLWGLVRDARDTHPGSFASWFAGSALVHDLVLAPVVFAVGLAVARTVPARVRPWMQGALVTSALVVAGSFPWAAGLGDRGGNASLLPGNYVLGLALVLAAVWLTAVAGALTSARRARPRRAGSSRRGGR
ncbi:MAG TPA: hypothetical protein VII47_02130 [Actinomycetota bacterium]|jgi:hypothetical protein